MTGDDASDMLPGFHRSVPVAFAGTGVTPAIWNDDGHNTEI
jgi:hypothetical protein